MPTPDNLELREKDGPRVLSLELSPFFGNKFWTCAEVTQFKDKFWQQSNEGIKEIIRLRNNLFLRQAKRTVAALQIGGLQ